MTSVSEATEAATAGGLVTRTVALVTTLVLADFTTALTTVRPMATSLHASPAWQTWSLGAMSLGLAASLLTVGSMADTMGRRRVLVIGCLGLSAATTLAAAAPTSPVFVGARVLQGATGAAVLAGGLAVLAHEIPSGAPRRRATGIWGAAVGAGIAGGPLLVAALSPWGDWRVSHAAEAVVALGLALLATRLPESRAAQARRLDLRGAVILAIAMTCLVAGLVEARQGWSRPVTFALLVAGVVALGLFGLAERRPDPMLELGLLRRPAFLISLTGAGVTGLTTIALMSYLQSFLQAGLGLTVAAGAGVISAWSLPSVLTAWWARRLPAGLGAAHRLAIGLLVCAGGLFALVIRAPGDAWSPLFPGLLLTGLGSGVVNAALGGLAVESVPAERPGLGSGANNTARYLGGAAGVALVLAVAAPGSHPGHPGRASLDTALTHGWNTAALVVGAISLAGALIVVLLERGLPRPASPAVH